MAYTITLTEQDCETIAFIGDRYNWSGWADCLTDGVNELSESEAWEFAKAIDEDTIGGHLPFPMLDEKSELYTKLQAFRDSIV